MRVLVAAVVLFAWGPLTIAQNSSFSVDRLVVYKRERKLVLLSHGEEMRSYKLALGGEPVGPKIRQGDHRTPEGVYVLDSRNPYSHFHKAFHISYPNAKDIAAAKKLGVSPGESYASCTSERVCMGRESSCSARLDRRMRRGY